MSSPSSEGECSLVSSTPHSGRCNFPEAHAHDAPLNYGTAQEEKQSSRNPPTFPRPHDSYIPGRDWSRPPRRDERSRRPAYESYVPGSDRSRNRSRSPARSPSTRYRSYHRRPSDFPLKSQQHLPRELGTFRRREDPHPTDGIIADLRKLQRLPSVRVTSYSPEPALHGTSPRVHEERGGKDAHRPRSIPAYRRPLDKPANYLNWTQPKLLSEVSIRRLSYEYDHPAYLAEILTVNDRRYSERWAEIKHMGVKELLEEAEAWDIDIDLRVSKEQGPLLTEIATPMARNAVSMHNDLLRAEEVARRQAESQAGAKVKPLSKASRLAREAAKAKAEKQKKTSPTTKPVKKPKSRNSQHSDSGYATGNTKSSTSPSSYGGLEDDDEGPLNRATERVAARRNSKQDHPKPTIASLQSEQTKSKKRAQSTEDEDLQASSPKKIPRMLKDDALSRPEKPIRSRISEHGQEPSKKPKITRKPAVRKDATMHDGDEVDAAVSGIKAVRAGRQMVHPKTIAAQAKNAVVVTKSEDQVGKGMTSVPGLYYLKML
ncbi:hypothetical protein EK21DRAFT_116095 [Setomelanomma holmii]|uniref:Uncharacterized protein n=1 Tax=Setomelanomma holmii TaxID=210430 RepID=A0A9P4H243_9PLEO|nr:hypothetical protein EK21DRAFT_116095 [Setomelanomma holmii]